MPGLDLAQMEASTPSGSGSPELLFLRISPDKFRFQILFDPPNSFTAEEWLKQSQALAVVNIGQYDKRNNYLGLLIKNGQLLSPLSNSKSGLFLAENPQPGEPQARVLDLNYSAFDYTRNQYLQGAQSLMLLDRYGHIRVRRTAKTAHRSLLAEDRQGNIVLIISRGRHTLWELADWLKRIDWLREIMCMDGGAEAQLAIKANGFSINMTGLPQALPDIPWPSANLPMALAIFPR